MRVAVTVSALRSTLNPQLYSVVQQRKDRRIEGSVYEKTDAHAQTLDEPMNQ